MVIAEEAEDSISLQCPVATHNEPTLPWIPLFLWERELGITDLETSRWGSEAGKGNPPPLKCEDTSGPLQLSLLAECPRRDLTKSHCLN